MLTGRLLLSLYFLSQLNNCMAKVTFERWDKAKKMSPFYGCKYAVTIVAKYCDSDDQCDFQCQYTDVVALGAMEYCSMINNVCLDDFVFYYNTECDSLKLKKFDFNKELIITAYENATKYIKTENNDDKIPRVPIAFQAKDYKMACDS